jgi:hypothetical protein
MNGWCAAFRTSSSKANSSDGGHYSPTAGGIAQYLSINGMTRSRWSAAPQFSATPTAFSSAPSPAANPTSRIANQGKASARSSRWRAGRGAAAYGELTIGINGSRWYPTSSRAS